MCGVIHETDSLYDLCERSNEIVIAVLDHNTLTLRAWPWHWGFCFSSALVRGLTLSLYKTPLKIFIAKPVLDVEDFVVFKCTTLTHLCTRERR
ncbi:hypothetical protein Mapa_013284 [Marchantia paleacea]|nr:hypothetical protein Mapa_013284 [Marchantia paleacea]